jgi:diphthine-ammonia ligase
MNAQIVKICSMGLTKPHLGKTILELRDHFQSLTTKFDFNVCGEGGEYESAVFDCPLYKKFKIVSKKQEVIMHEDNEICPVAYLQYQDLELVEKSAEDQ